MRALRKNLPQVTKFDVRTLRKDSNCIAIQDPSAVWGIQDFLPRRNLLTYSEDFSNAAWGKIDITVTANNTTDPFGGSAADLLTEGSAGTAACQQSISAGSGTKFIATVYIKPKENITWIRLILSDNGATNRIKLWANLSTGAIGTANADSGGSLVSATVDTASNGFYVLTLKGSISATSVYFYIQSATANEATTRASGASYWVFGAQLTRADTIDQSYQKISDWVTEQYAWAAARQVPWLRRNRFVATEDLSSGSYTKTGLLAFGSGSIANAIKAPDGTLTADLIVEDTSTGQHRAYQSFSNTNTTVTLSIYAKPKERTWLALRITSYSPADRYQWFNLSGSGVIGTTQSELSNPTITAIADGWYRCSVTLVNTSNTTCVVQVNLANADNVSSYTGDGSSGLYVWGMQAEHSSSATTYQPILASWDATYTANAIAAGYPISLWHDSAGTIAAWESGRAIGAVRDQKYEGYGANLVSNGTFDSDTTYFSANANATVTWSDGQALVDVTGASGGIKTTNNLATRAGYAYLVTFDLVAGTFSGNLQTYIAGVTVGTHTVPQYKTRQMCVFMASSTSTSFVINRSSAVTGTFYIDNISVREIPGYTAIQSTGANCPPWVLDANGKAYFNRDTVNDALPITLPAVLSDSQLGPELVTNGTFTGSATGWTLHANVSYSSNAIVFDGVSTSAYARQDGVTTEGKTYRVGFTISSYTSGGLRFLGGTAGSSITMPVSAYTAAGDYSFTFTASSTTAGRFWAYSQTPAFNGTVDNISVREVTGTNVVYTAEGNVSLKDSGLILSGSYAPITPAADYGRIIMAGESRYDAKILKYLDGKRGRAYSLGAEIIPSPLNIQAAGWSAVSATIDSGTSFTNSSGGGAGVVYAAALSVTKSYVFSLSYSKTTSTIIGIYVPNASYPIVTSTATSSTISAVAFPASAGGGGSVYIRVAGNDTVTINSISIREVLL